MSHLRHYGRRQIFTGALLCLIASAAQVRATDQADRSWEEIYQDVAGSLLPEGMQKHLGVVLGVWPKQISISETAYGWEWLSSRHDANKDGSVTSAEFRCPAEFFKRLDRSRDGVLTREDFDWSEKSSLLTRAQQANQTMQRLDHDSNGRISAEEWQAIFTDVAKSKGYLDPQDLQDLFYPHPSVFSRKSMYWTLLAAMLRGDLGTPYGDAPTPGRLAPDFTLKTKDGDHEITLAQFRGKRPVVLVFGSFT